MPSHASSASFRRLEREILQCRKCDRLVCWREKVAEEKVARYAESEYWGRAVPGFGDPAARLLVVGLAPAAHGANRTGRMFTGDRSGEWLYRALFTFGFSGSAVSASREDGLVLRDCYITAAARCAPPANKLLREEIANCRPYLLGELALLRNLRVIVGLGRTAFDAAFDSLKSLGGTGASARPAFGHGKKYRISEGLTLIASYHPSQQNTFTGKLTRPMFHAVFREARRILQSSNEGNER
ncbi:MAG TPA: uracil-DNA glycosylase [Bacteroidota bacterium]|nr:uracil-DNA glycosylase [Bacteroidota bacterium]